MTATATPELKMTKKAGIKAVIRTSIITLLMTLAFLALIAGYGRHRYGSVSASLAYLRGERLLVDKPYQAIGGVHPGGQVVVRYAVTNESEHSVNLIGMTCSCTCTIVENLPKTLGASETKIVSARVNLAEGKTDVSGAIRLYTDDPHSPEIPLAFSVRAAKSNRSGVLQGQ